MEKGKLTLRPYQQDAVKKAINVKNCLMCMITGSGKTIIAMFLARYLIKRKLIDKVVIACTLSSTNVFIKDYKDKANIDVYLVDKEEEFFKFLESGDRVCIIKHSFFTDLGFTQKNLDRLEDLLSANYQKILLIVDEAHEISNPTSKGHLAYNNVKFVWDRIVLQTATPYSSCITQIFGLVHLIYPYLWGDIYAFKDKYVKEKRVKNWKTGKTRPEIEEYINLPHLRKVLEPFTFFYYPKINLNFHNHTTKLKDYTEYDKLAEGVIEE